MALSKKAKHNLLAALVGGIIVIEGIGVYNLTNEVNSLETNNIKLEKTINDQKKEIEKKKDSINNLTQERDNFKNSTEDLKDKNKVLEEKLQAKIEKESSEAQSRTSENPTSNASVKSGKGTPVTMTLSFYGDGDEENGGYGGITAYGEPLRAGIVASNVHPRGTKFEYNGQVYTVGDKGGESHFNNSNRLDVFVPRQAGESKDAYDRRISNYGKQTVTMYKL